MGAATSARPPVAAPIKARSDSAPWRTRLVLSLFCAASALTFSRGVLTGVVFLVGYYAWR